MSVFTKPHIFENQRWKNKRVGLLGGSFNPPHEGHLHISKMALKALDLDCVWWLVSPQNPLKTQKPLPLEKRMGLCNDLVDHPQILVSDIEKDLGTNLTFDSVRKLKTYFPHTDFVWIGGMDIALSLHEWTSWQDLLKEVCMLHLTRFPAQTLVKNTPLRMYKKQRHRYINKGGRFSLDSGTTYWLMQKKMVDVSSTHIRNNSLKKQ